MESSKVLFPANVEKINKQVAYAEKYTPVINRYLRGEGLVKDLVVDVGVDPNKFNHETYQVYTMRSTLLKHRLGPGKVLSKPVLETHEISDKFVPLQLTNKTTPLHLQCEDSVYYRPRPYGKLPKEVCPLTKGVPETLEATAVITTDRCQYMIELTELVKRSNYFYLTGTDSIFMGDVKYKAYVELKLEDVFKGEMPVGQLAVQVVSPNGARVPYKECVYGVRLSYRYRLHQVMQEGIDDE